MSENAVTISEIKEMVESYLANHTQSELARGAGVSIPYVNDLVKGKRNPGNKIALFFGYLRVTRFVPVANGERSELLNG